jgi:hypothetical protein
MKSTLPPAFVAWLRALVLSSHFTTPRRLHRGLIFRWCLWLDGHHSNAIPGYLTPPPADPRTGLPAGWTLRLISDIARETIGTTAIHRARQAAASISSPLTADR